MQPTCIRTLRSAVTALCQAERELAYSHYASPSNVEAAFRRLKMQRKAYIQAVSKVCAALQQARRDAA